MCHNKWHKKSHNSPMWGVVVGEGVSHHHPSTNHNSPHLGELWLFLCHFMWLEGLLFRLPTLAIMYNYFVGNDRANNAKRPIMKFEKTQEYKTFSFDVTCHEWGPRRNCNLECDRDLHERPLRNLLFKGHSPKCSSTAKKKKNL